MRLFFSINRVIGIFWVCVCAFLIFNIKEVIRMFRICMYAFLTWLFFNMNGVIEIFGSMDKNFRVCRYAFLFILKLQINRVCQNRLLYTSTILYLIRYTDVSLSFPLESPIVLSILNIFAWGVFCLWVGGLKNLTVSNLRFRSLAAQKVSQFSRIRTEYWDLQSKSLYSIQIQENLDQQKLCIWTLFTQCMY